MQSAALALSNTYGMLVQDKFFEVTESALREIPAARDSTAPNASTGNGGNDGGNDGSDVDGAMDGAAPPKLALLPQEASSLRRALATGIKKCSAAEQQIDACLAALQRLEHVLEQRLKAKETREAREADPATGHKQRGRPGGGGGAGRPRKKAAGERAVPPKFRPPHLLRDPEAGDAVAARIASHELWILAVVTHVTSRGGAGGGDDCYQVQDIDGSRSFKLARAQVIPLPLPHETALSEQWHAAGVRCFAMYPETTGFYPAKVLPRPPSPTRPRRNTFFFSRVGMFLFLVLFA
jgi:hypothetical protein